MNAVEAICRIFDSIGASYALIGGRAVSVRGHPRMTLDYDFLTTNRGVLQADVWRDLEQFGATIDPRKGDFDDPLAGVVHISFDDGMEVDVVVAKWKWQQAVIDRADNLDFGGTRLPVPRTSDLILLKLTAGGHLDLQDVAALLAVSDVERVVREVDENIHLLDPDASAAWKRIRPSVVSD
jgi:hypothetical protein